MTSEFTIGFDEKLVPLVLSGEKKLTYRLGNKFDNVEIGAEIPARDSSTNKIFGKLKITGKSDTTFRELPIDHEGHETYESKEKQKEMFEKYYGSVEDDDKVVILEFELLK
jgi:hypothetical protein